MISSERKYNKFSKTLSPKLAAWLADDHTYISDTRNRLVDWRLKKEFPEVDWEAKTKKYFD